MGKIAFVFAGQGAQYPGMGLEVYNASPRAREMMDRLDQLRPGLLKACFEPEDGGILTTRAVQPCLYAVDLACALYAEDAGLNPDCVAGFSLGEIPAVAYAGMVSLEEGFRLVNERAERMQACAEKTEGCMYAVLRLEPEKVGALCAELTDVYPVNYNTKEQTVVAMASASEAAFLNALKGAGARAVKLKVSGAFHTPFMKEASDALLVFLNSIELKEPRFPVYSNVTGIPYEGDKRVLLSAQASSPVRWRASVERMIESGVRTFVEVGPGSVLSGLIRKINPDVHAVNIENVATLEKALSILANS